MRREGSRAVVSGPVTLANVRALLEEGRGHIRAGVDTVDLGEVTELDSSLLAVLLAWRREARTADCELAIEHLPAGLETIARLYGVESLLSGATPRH
ncbi:MAG TPA: STAS domain-containing protein [Burkholderiales bacterium]|nr:STAS domain-containing protein [Burkholderiales bacterium]